MGKVEFVFLGGMFCFVGIGFVVVIWDGVDEVFVFFCVWVGFFSGNSFGLFGFFFFVGLLLGVDLYVDVLFGVGF